MDPTQNLSQRLAALETAELTRNALTDYCFALDSSDLDLLRQTFSDDIQLTLPDGQSVVGNAAVVTFFADAITTPAEHRKHFVTNISIERSEAMSASGHCYFQSLLGQTGDFHLAWGRFNFVTRRDGDHVRIERFAMIVEQMPSPAFALSAIHGAA